MDKIITLEEITKDLKAVHGIKSIDLGKFANHVQDEEIFMINLQKSINELVQDYPEKAASILKGMDIKLVKNADK